MLYISDSKKLNVPKVVDLTNDTIVTTSNNKTYKSSSQTKLKLSAKDLHTKAAPVKEKKKRTTKKKEAAVKNEFELAMSAAMNVAIAAAREWEISLEEKYNNEDEALSILGMMSYHMNKERGFGKRNDEIEYRSLREQDIGGRWYEEALRGCEFMRECDLIRLAWRGKRI